MTDCTIQPQNMKSSTNIKVFVRVRPFNDKEQHDRTCISSIVDRTIAIKDAKQSHSFTFDRIFDGQSSQQQVYATVGQQIINEAFKGLNGTIFCYGQTSSGKTHTIIGPDLNNRENSGILPRLVQETLAKIQLSPKNIEIKMKVSMVEIYNQKIKDLLDPSKNDLKIRSNKKQGIFLENLTEKYILAEQQAFSLISQGISNRAVNSTNMNSQSSRSHLVFILNLHIHDFYSGQAKSSKIILVDLAGSQKISKTGAEGKVLEQAKKINASLTALGKVINILSQGKNSHVPYRDSKLTRLLQQSLGGNSLTNLIVNISPSSFNESETLTSIRFGQRAKSIKNEPIVNKSYTVEQLLGLLKRAEETIQRQNSIITDLSKKKRTGGYGAIAVPIMITMHVIDDDNGSIQFSQASLEGEDFQDGQSTTNDMFCRSDGRLMSVHKNKASNQNLDFEMEYINDDDNISIASRSAVSHKRCLTMDQFPSMSHLSKKQIYWQDEEQNKQNLKEKQNIESKSSIKFLENQKAPKQSNQKVIGFSNIVTEIPNNPIPKQQDKLKEQFKTTMSTDINVKTQKPSQISLSTTQQNLNKIRNNLLELKLMYLKQKKQNETKTQSFPQIRTIINQKNKIIQNHQKSNIRESIR